MSASKVLVPVTIAAAINLVHAVPRGHDAVIRVGIGNVALAVILTGMAELNDEFATALAVVYLTGSALINGKPFIEWFDTIIGQGKANPSQPSPLVSGSAVLTYNGTNQTPAAWKPQPSSGGFGGSF